MVWNHRNAVPVLPFLSWKGGPEREPQGGAPGRPGRLGAPQIFSIALRLISLLLIIGALFLLGADALTSLADGGHIHVRSLAQAWGEINPGGLAAFRGWLSGLSPTLTNGIDNFLVLPGWGVTGVLGVLLAFLAGRHTEL